MNKTVKELHGVILRNLELIKTDIDNCPDSLWGKRIGGDYYWQQVFHVIAGTAGMLNENMELESFAIPHEVAFLEQVPNMPPPLTYTGSHGKEVMYEALETARKHIGTYFSRLEDEELLKETDFIGIKMTLLAKIVRISGHIMYHVGVFDAALRDHGAKASM